MKMSESIKSENSLKMNKLKKAMLTTMVSTSMLTSFVSPILAADSTGDQAKDLGKASNWAKDAIVEAIKRGLIEGDGTGNVKPLENMSRAQVATLLARSLGLKIDNVSASSFKDIGSENWASPYIEALHKVGIFEGDGESFRPNDLLTREELAVLLVRITQTSVNNKGQNLAVKDSDKVSDWAKPYVQAALESGLMTASDNGEFGGKSIVSREMVTVATVRLTDKEEFTKYKEEVKTLFVEGKKISNSDPAA